MPFWIHLKCLTYLLDFAADDAASQKSLVKSNNKVILLLLKSKCKSNMLHLLHSNT